MPSSYHLDAPAKVNLGLRITGRRDDGYHTLESLFAPLDLADSIALSIEAAPGPSVALQLCGGSPDVPAGPENLAYRAAHTFLELTGIAARVEIGLTKHVPSAAGLGGGSSDAASVLRALMRAFPDALEEADLEHLALSLGADVPFFLDPGPAWVSGVGERREPVHDLPALALLLANPGEGLATAEVFRAFDVLRREPPARFQRPAALAQLTRNAGVLRRLLHNDLEPAALRLCPAIGRLRRTLEATGALAVGLSGSGATLFAVFPDRSSAEAAAGGLGLPPAGWTRVAATREWG